MVYQFPGFPSLRVGNVIPAVGDDTPDHKGGHKGGDCFT